jgi:hypothetical protein
MDIQLNDISEIVLRKAGEALYYAQRLEHSLVTQLLVRERISERVITAAMIHDIEVRVRSKKATLGRLIKELDDKLGVMSPESSFEEALRYRNFLAHDFFHKYRHVAGLVTLNRRMLVDLEIIVMEFKSTIDVIQQWTKGLAMTHGIDIAQIESEYETALTFDTEYIKATDLVPRTLK